MYFWTKIEERHSRCLIWTKKQKETSFLRRLHTIEVTCLLHISSNLSQNSIGWCHRFISFVSFRNCFSEFSHPDSIKDEQKLNRERKSCICYWCILLDTSLCDRILYLSGDFVCTLPFQFDVNIVYNLILCTVTVVHNSDVLSTWEFSTKIKINRCFCLATILFTNTQKKHTLEW